jgi:polyhydroxyalkanoate synthesis regulator phasin
MTPDDNLIPETDSSPVSNIVDTSDVDTDSSPVITNSVEDSETASIVRDVVQETPPDSQPEIVAEPEPEAQISEEPKVPDDENFSDVPFHKHPRFQQLLRKSKEAEHDAKMYRNVQMFIDEHGLSAEEAADALIVAGLIKTNPVQALEKLKPIVSAVVKSAGEVLPDDLENRVKNGEMSHDAALDVSRSRAYVESIQRAQHFERQRYEAERYRQIEQACQSSAQTWAQERTARDPRFEQKIPLLEDAVAGLQRREGVPNTPDGVRDMLARAYAIVNERYALSNPVPQQKPPITPITGGQVAATRTEPKSTLDIIRMHRKI